MRSLQSPIVKFTQLETFGLLKWLDGITYYIIPVLLRLFSHGFLLPRRLADVIRTLVSNVPLPVRARSGPSRTGGLTISSK